LRSWGPRDMLPGCLRGRHSLRGACDAGSPDQPSAHRRENRRRKSRFPARGGCLRKLRRTRSDRARAPHGGRSSLRRSLRGEPKGGLRGTGGAYPSAAFLLGCIRGAVVVSGIGAGVSTGCIRRVVPVDAFLDSSIGCTTNAAPNAPDSQRNLH
jgi:hypothetical protein